MSADKKSNVYILAMTAMQPALESLARINPRTGKLCVTVCGEAGQEIELEHTRVIVPLIVVASSQDGAKDVGLEIMKKKYPESEGWIDHFAGPMLVDSASAKQVLSLIGEERQPEEMEDDSLPLM